MANWTCNVCQKQMNEGSKKSHLAGKPHLKKAQGAVIAPIKDTVSPTSTCIICDTSNDLEEALFYIKVSRPTFHQLAHARGV